MYAFKRIQSAFAASISLIKLLILCFLVNLQVQAASAEATTLMLPLHTILPASKNASVAGASSGSENPGEANTTITPSAAIAQSDAAHQSTGSQAETTAQRPDGMNVMPDGSAAAVLPPAPPQPTKLKGRVTVPANPYRGVNNSSTPFAPEGTLRRALPAPLDPVFPSTEYIGIASQLQIGIPDQDQMFPLEKAIYKACPFLAKNRIKIYGWVNPGVDYSTSHHANTPLSYFTVPNHIELDQLVFRAERVPDTVQN